MYRCVYNNNDKGVILFLVPALKFLHNAFSVKNVAHGFPMLYLLFT